MYRLLIVEDEKWEREGLRDFLDWRSLGIEVTGCACNGVEGVKLAELYRPDIILTDIMMPKMDGIQMSQNIRAFLPDSKIIILSGHDDFGYAKQTFTFHASAYILKPIEKTNIQEVILRVLIELDREKERVVLKSRWEDYICENKNRLLLNMLESNSTLEYPSEIVPVKGTSAQGKIVIAVMTINSISFGCKQEDVNTFEFILNEKGMAFSFTKPFTEVVLCLDAPATQEELQEQLIELGNCLKKGLDIDVIIGIGEAVEGFSEASGSYSQAKEASSFRFLAEYGELLFYSKIKEINHMSLDFAKPLVQKTYCIIKKILYITQKNRPEELPELLDEFLSTLKDICSLSKLLLNKFFTEAMYILNSAININTREKSYEYILDKKRFEADFSKQASIKQTKQYLMNFLKTITEYSLNSTSNTDAEVAQKVIEIIEVKYADDLDLKCISKDIHLTPYYIGSIFKKNTGKPFNQYLNDYRIDKAKEMLQTEKITVSQLSDAVGIKNTSYFCLLFKNRFGISPGEYIEILKGRR